MSEKNGGPAYPQINYWDSDRMCIGESGMTLRDYFAAKAMQGMLPNAEATEFEWHDFDMLAVAAYAQADAMLKARQA